MLKLVTLSLVKTEKERVDGKVSRQYYTASFQDPANPFAPVVSRTIWQQHNNEGTEATWKQGDPAVVRTYLNKLVPAQIVSKEVPEYTITVNGPDGQPMNRYATKYTTVVFGHETVEAVFKSAGHELKTTPVTENAIPATATAPLAEEIITA